MTAIVHANPLPAEDLLPRLQRSATELHRAGRFAEAQAVCVRILERYPREGGALHLLGIISAQNGDLPRALELLVRAAQVNASSANVHFNLGKLQMQMADHRAALDSLGRSIALRPDFAEAHLHHAYALRVLERPADALRAFDAAIALMPSRAEPHAGRADALQDLHRPHEALKCYDEALQRAPDYAQAAYNKGLCLLQLGRFREGWPLAEWRRLHTPLGNRTFPVPRWTGEEDLAGKTLLLHPEQGLGDTIQFSRYVTHLSGQGVRVVLMVQTRLQALMRQSWPGIEVLDEQTSPGAIDYHCPLLSVPAACRTHEGSIPAEAPYLRAAPDRIERWRATLGDRSFKVGICWQGRTGLVDVGRSFPLAAAAPLAAAGVRLICLQQSASREQVRGLPAPMAVEVPAEPLDAGPDAFLDTAAILQNLDLIITCDTSIAHLAGALGRPAWVALKRVPDWRWMLEGADTPWYPTLRLYRQERSGDWEGVFRSMARDLLALLRNGSGSPRPRIAETGA